MSDPSETDGLSEARETIAKLDVFASLDPARCDIKRLGGLTNLVFQVEARVGRSLSFSPGMS